MKVIKTSSVVFLLSWKYVLRMTVGEL